DERFFRLLPRQGDDEVLCSVLADLKTLPARGVRDQFMRRGFAGRIGFTRNAAPVERLPPQSLEQRSGKSFHCVEGWVSLEHAHSHPSTKGGRVMAPVFLILNF